jgi:hypothetical protein
MPEIRPTLLAAALAVASLVVVGSGGSAGAEAQSADFTTPGTTSFVVPADVTEITVDVYGAEGGAGPNGRNPGIDDTGPITPTESGGGLGGRAQAVIPVTPGETLTLVVGEQGGDGVCVDGAVTSAGGAGGTGAGTGGDGGGSKAAISLQTFCSGGGGGGGSAILRGTELLVVGGGGGGGAGLGNLTTDNTISGGAGGGATGTAGSPDAGVAGGEPGTASAPGAGGVPNGNPGVGPDGGDGFVPGVNDTTRRGNGGGGGGLFGGGAGATQTNSGGPGGGGSGRCSGTCLVFAAGVQAGNGRVLITIAPAPIVVSPTFTG